MEHIEIPRVREQSYDKIDQACWMRRPRYDDPLNNYSFLDVHKIILSKPGQGPRLVMLSSEECRRILECSRNEDITERIYD